MESQQIIGSSSIYFPRRNIKKKTHDIIKPKDIFKKVVWYFS